MMESTLSPFPAASFLSLLLDVSLKSLSVFVLAGLGCLCLRRASAASRHALWAVTVLSLLCLPVFCVLLPRWSIAVLPAMAQHHAQTLTPVGSKVEEMAPQQPLATEQPPTAGMGKPSPQASPATSSAPSLSSPTPSVSAPDVSPLSAMAPAIPPVVQTPRPITSRRRPAALMPTMKEVVILIWLVGVLTVLARTFVGIMAARRLVRGCHEVATGPLAEAAEQARMTLGLSYGVAVWEGPLGTAVMVPMTFGLLRPVVLLPSGAADWPAERLQVVMLHEIAHVKRRDWLTTMLAEVVCALYWFHPLIWLAAHRLRVESEQASDDLVLTSGVQAVDYADHLLEVVRGLTGRRGIMPAVVTMAQERDLTGRMKAILTTSNNRNSVTSPYVLVTATVAACFVGPLAALHPVASAKADVIKAHIKAQPPVGIPFTSPIAAQNLGAMMSSPLRLAKLMAGKSRWEKNLSDGTRVRLLFVGAQNAEYNIISSWTPDGTLQGPGDAVMRPPSIYGKHGYQFVYGVTFASAKRQNTSALSFAQAGERADIAGGVLPWHKGEPNWLNFPALFPEDQTKATVLVNVFTGPETTLFASPPQTGATLHLPTGETVKVTKAIFKLFREQHHLTQTTEVAVSLPTRYVQDISESSFYPVDWNGKRINVHDAGRNLPDTTKKMAHMTFHFRTSELPLSRVKEFRFEYRPSQTATFRDVALQPVASAASTFPVVSAQKEKSDRGTSLSNLRLIGLALVKYVADHHERFPDAAHWMDQIIPYLIPSQIKGAERQQRIAALFHDPASPPGQLWSYSFNKALSGLSLFQIDNPAQIVAVFESSQGIKNASDGGQSLPQPGRHSGGSDFLFADGHNKFLSVERTPLLFAKLNPPVLDSSGNLTRPQDTIDYWFAPVNPGSRQKIPIQGQVYDRRTMKPLSSTFVIFSQLPNKITVGSVWPASFTNKAGRFQSVMYPGKNYLMVLEDNRFRLVGKTLDYQANGNKGSISTQGTKAGLSRSAQSDYIIRWSLPHGYSLQVSSDRDKTTGAKVTVFVPVADTGSR